MKRVIKRNPTVVPKLEIPNKVKTVVLNSRKLIRHRIGDTVDFNSFKDAIVWVQPVKGTTPEQLATTVESIKGFGAARVLPLALESTDAVVAAATVEELSRNSHVGVREAVEELLLEVKEQPKAVRDIVESVLSKVGL